MQPFYSDAIYGAGKEIESRNCRVGAERSHPAPATIAQGHLSDTTRIAFDNAWALQSKTGPDAGAWVWQNFDYTPWESKESQYHWAALMAVAVAKAPDHYRDDPKIAANLRPARLPPQPLRRAAAAEQGRRAVGLGAVSRPAHPTQRKQLIEHDLSLQRPDGGWSLTDLGAWKRRDKTPLETRSDGYATGLVVLVLEETARIANPIRTLLRGIAWLIANQDKTTGAWPAWSLNKNRDPKSNVGQFMSDAATGYAVLALEARR